MAQQTKPRSPIQQWIFMVEIFPRPLFGEQLAKVGSSYCHDRSEVLALDHPCT